MLGLQDRGSSRLTSYLRGKETATFVGEDSTVRRWRETSFGPLLALLCVILAVVIGSRTCSSATACLRGSVPAVPGEPLSQLLDDYRQLRSGRSAPPAIPTAWAVVAFTSVVSLFRHVVADDDVGRRLLPARRSARGDW